MERVIVVRGELADARHIELEEPVTEIKGRVEVRSSAPCRKSKRRLVKASLI